MKKILIIFAHPALQKSKVNKILIEGVEELEGVTFHDIYQAYPEMDIEVQTEKDYLEEHDIIIFQHPLFWYSTPAILKEWQDLVLEHGWAYGSQGNALKDKLFFNVITTGGQENTYCEEGYNCFTIRQLIVPIEQTVKLCKMVYLPPYVVHGTHTITEEQIRYHKEEYFNLLALLQDGQIDLNRAQKFNYFNHYFE